jgi:hypothetical protein
MQRKKNRRERRRDSFPNLISKNCKCKQPPYEHFDNWEFMCFVFCFEHRKLNFKNETKK